jgi:glucokinase
MSNLTGAIEVGGSHIAAAVIDVRQRLILKSRRLGIQLSAMSTSQAILGAIAEVANDFFDKETAQIGVALPGPFDYEAGIGRYRDEEKFHALANVDIESALRDLMWFSPSEVSFLNDADAFLIGEWSNGAAFGHQRAAAITLGTGVGSSFLTNGVTLNEGPGVPPDGSIHNVDVGGIALEDVVSRSAIVRAYWAAVGSDRTFLEVDVDDIARFARSGDRHARDVLNFAFTTLGETLATSLDEFEPTVLVVGGRISLSWDIVRPALLRGLSLKPSCAGILVAPAQHLDDSPLLGTAIHACSQKYASECSPGAMS